MISTELTTPILLIANWLVGVNKVSIKKTKIKIELWKNQAKWINE